MTEILILAGPCGEGPGSYDLGVFHLPDGSARGVEDVTDLIASPDPVAASVTRRGGIARGLRDALGAGFPVPLPRPFGLAVSVLDAGLDLLGGDGRSGVSLAVRFADGATATIRTDAACAAAIARDREVLRLSDLRRKAPLLPRPPDEPVVSEPAGAVLLLAAPEPDPPGPDARALASIFAYEKRGGRLRRLAAKAADEA